MKMILSVVGIFASVAAYASPNCSYELVTCAGEPNQYCSMYIGTPAGYCPDSSCDCIDGPGVVVVNDSEFISMTLMSGQVINNVQPGQTFPLSQIRLIRKSTGIMYSAGLIQAGARTLRIGAN